jgi:integrase
MIWGYSVIEKSVPPMLTEVQIKNAKPGEKAKRLWDERGLYLEVTPAGGKVWRFKYYTDGKEKRIGLGKYPEVSLKEARERREEARKLRANGIDPSVHRQAEKAAAIRQASNSFEIVAREWHLKQAPTWSASNAKITLRRLEQDVFPYLGNAPIDSIKAPELLAVLRQVETRGAVETAHRELQTCGQIFRYAIATGRAERDISRDLKGALSPIPSKNHHGAVTEPERLAEVLRMLWSCPSSLVVQSALKLTPLLFVRPGELRHAKWSEIDFEKAEWRFNLSKTKVPHIVPLATQAIEILQQLKLLTGRGEYVFPSARSRQRPMSENAVTYAIRSLGLTGDEVTGHGFRATARTILDEVLKYPPHLIEHQLGHVVRDPLGRSYNRTTHLEERRAMMQAWADYLDELKGGESNQF